MNRHVFILAGVITLIATSLYQVATKVNLNIPREIEIRKKINNKEYKYMLEIKSPAFENKTNIPSKYTCEGDNINPPLEISGVPKEAKSLTLIMEDPDVPKNLRPDGMFDHWIVFNIPTTSTLIEEGTEPPGIQALNSRGSSDYIGPCPPDREHRYFFKLYALDTILPSFSSDTKKEIESAMDGHIIDKAEFIGLYNKKH